MDAKYCGDCSDCQVGWRLAFCSRFDVRLVLETASGGKHVVRRCEICKQAEAETPNPLPTLLDQAVADVAQFLARKVGATWDSTITVSGPGGHASMTIAAGAGALPSALAPSIPPAADLEERAAPLAQLMTEMEVLAQDTAGMPEERAARTTTNFGAVSGLQIKNWRRAQQASDEALARLRAHFSGNDDCDGEGGEA